MLAQVMPAFGAERARVGDVFDIGLNERKRFLALPRPVRGIEATALFARAVGCWCVASEAVSDGVGGEVDAVLGEVSGEVLASVVVFLVALQHALVCWGRLFWAGVWGFWAGRAVRVRRIVSCLTHWRTRCGEVLHRRAVSQEFWVCWSVGTMRLRALVGFVGYISL